MITEATNAEAITTETAKAHGLRVSLANRSLYTLVTLDELGEAGALLHEGMVLGPIPATLWRDEEWYIRPTIACHELEALGLTWQPLPEDSSLYPQAWYTRSDGPDGARYVARDAGYWQALAHFVASPEAARLAALAGRYPRGVVPHVTLYPDGHWEAGTDGLTQPVVLPIVAVQDLAKRLQGDLSFDLDGRTWPN